MKNTSDGKASEDTDEDDIPSARASVIITMDDEQEGRTESELVTRYTYDSFNRLLRYSDHDGSTCYSYNADGYRTAKYDYDDSAEGSLVLSNGISCIGYSASSLKDDISSTGNSGSSKKTKDTPTSQNQMQKQVERGKAPNSVDRVDKPHVEGQQPHIHFGENEAALNLDGTWHDEEMKAIPKIDNKIKKWLIDNGWSVPKWKN